MAKMQKLQKLNMTFFFSILFIGLLWRSWRKCEICGLCHLKESGGNVFSQIVSMQILSFPGRVSCNSGESEAGLAELTRQLSAVSPLPAMSLDVRPCLTTCLSNYISIFNLPEQRQADFHNYLLLFWAPFHMIVAIMFRVWDEVLLFLFLLTLLRRYLRRKMSQERVNISIKWM